ncbi:SCO2322 family protein [Streptomyces sp. NPDC048442]|uniref:SCO2322 family protein n=1 Tax=Streptomyces sp. NPDC048442 TaxID=3154823 RepID=UPI00343AD463
MNLRTKLGAPLVTVAAALCALAPAAQAAEAAYTSDTSDTSSSGYRYWSFWERDGSKWAYATQGASTTHPADGAVQGFRFAVSQDSQDAAKPRGNADFGAACAKTPAKEDTKRIALVLDFGTAQDAPAGEKPPAPRTVCAQVGTDATTAEALAEVARPLRYNNAALLCAIAGYPKAGCAEQVSGKSSAAASPSPASSDSASSSAAGQGEGDGGPSAGLIVGFAAVLVLGAAAVWQARRRRG